jgi:hypothetical protein
MDNTPLQSAVVQQGEEATAAAVAGSCCSNKGVLVVPIKK